MTDIQQVTGIRLEHLEFKVPSGAKHRAYLMKPADSGQYPVILYLHWYEPHSPITNQAQYLNEGAAWAEHGVMTLHISTAWSAPAWFIERDNEQDLAFSEQQAVDLRAIYDAMLTLDEVNHQQTAVVGHDFGAMYGTLAFAEEKRLNAFVFIAGTAAFPDWFMFTRRDHTPEQEAAFRDTFKALDPVTHIGKFAPTPLLMQFGTGDFYTPDDRIEALWNAANDPKHKSAFAGGHGVNEDARTERVAWLAQHLGIDIPKTWFLPPQSTA